MQAMWCANAQCQCFIALHTSQPSLFFLVQDLSLLFFYLKARSLAHSSWKLVYSSGSIGCSYFLLFSTIHLTWFIFQLVFVQVKIFRPGLSIFLFEFIFWKLYLYQHSQGCEHDARALSLRALNSLCKRDLVNIKS